MLDLLNLKLSFELFFFAETQCLYKILISMSHQHVTLHNSSFTPIVVKQVWNLPFLEKDNISDQRYVTPNDSKPKGKKLYTHFDPPLSLHVRFLAAHRGLFSPLHHTKTSCLGFFYELTPPLIRPQTWTLCCTPFSSHRRSKLAEWTNQVIFPNLAVNKTQRNSYTHSIVVRAQGGTVMHSFASHHMITRARIRHTCLLCTKYCWTLPWNCSPTQQSRYSYGPYSTESVQVAKMKGAQWITKYAFTIVKKKKKKVPSLPLKGLELFFFRFKETGPLQRHSVQVDAYCRALTQIKPGDLIWKIGFWMVYSY